MSKQNGSKAASIYTAIPTWLYDLILIRARKYRRTLAAQIAFDLEKRYPQKGAK